VVVSTAYAMVGTLLLLGSADPCLIPICLGFALPAFGFGRVCIHQAGRLNRRLNDELEREIGVVGGGSSEDVRCHYGAVARQRIDASDWQAAHFAVAQSVVLGVAVAALLRAGAASGGDAGTIIATYRYAQMFATGLENSVVLIPQLARLADIGRRLQDPSAESTPSGEAPYRESGPGPQPSGPGDC